MNTLEQRIRSFEMIQQIASDHVDELVAAEPDLSATELEDEYYRVLDSLQNAKTIKIDYARRVDAIGAFLQDTITPEERKRGYTGTCTWIGPVEIAVERKQNLVADGNVILNIAEVA